MDTTLSLLTRAEEGRRAYSLPPMLLSVDTPGPRADSLPDLEDVFSEVARHVHEVSFDYLGAHSSLADGTASPLVKEVSLESVYRGYFQ